MSSKNIQINYNSGAEYNILYPQTRTSQVIGLDTTLTALQNRGYVQVATGEWQGTGTILSANAEIISFTVGFTPVLLGIGYQKIMPTELFQVFENEAWSHYGTGILAMYNSSGAVSNMVSINRGYRLNQYHYYGVCINLSIGYQTTMRLGVVVVDEGDVGDTVRTGCMFNLANTTYSWIAVGFVT